MSHVPIKTLGLVHTVPLESPFGPSVKKWRVVRSSWDNIRGLPTHSSTHHYWQRMLFIQHYLAYRLTDFHYFSPSENVYLAYHTNKYYRLIYMWKPINSCFFLSNRIQLHISLQKIKAIRIKWPEIHSMTQWHFQIRSFHQNNCPKHWNIPCVPKLSLWSSD